MQAGAVSVSVERDGAVQYFIEIFWREVGRRSEKRSSRMIVAFDSCADALHWSQNAGYHDRSGKDENSAAFLNNYIYGAMPRTRITRAISMHRAR